MIARVRLWPVLAMALLSPGLVQADELAAATNSDTRIATVESAPGEVIRLRAVPGYEVLVLMPRGEHIMRAQLPDAAGWHVSLTAARDGMSIYALRPVIDTSFAVTGEQRSYDFTLSASVDIAPPVVVRLVNRTPSIQPASADVSRPVDGSAYRLSGDRRLMPDSMSDDGQKMYITWGDNQPIPAVFAVDTLGHEEMTDGYMRNGRFTLDRLYDHLVFRIDKAEASAVRNIAKARRK